MVERAKLNLRLPADLHAEATQVAEAMGISLNAFCTLAVRNWVDYQGSKVQSRAKSLLGPRVGLQAGQVAARPTPEVRREAVPPAWAKTGRNEPCPCGSGKKFKFCHGAPQ